VPQSLAVDGTVDSFIEMYARRYTQRDVEGITDLCLWPFLAIRGGRAIHLRDRAAVRDHIAGEVMAYRIATGTATWTPIEVDVRQLGEHAAFATVRWNANDADGDVVRDTWTSFQLLKTPEGWRFLSYVNHF